MLLPVSIVQKTGFRSENHIISFGRRLPPDAAAVAASVAVAVAVADIRPYKAS